MRFYDESFVVSAPLRCFPDLSAFWSRFGSSEKRQNAASLLEDINAKKFLISDEIRNFFAYMARHRDAVFLRFSFDPNADPKAETTGEERIASSAPLPLFFVFTSPD